LVTLKVFDVLGNEVATVVNENLPAGTHRREFDARVPGEAAKLASGVYIYRMQVLPTSSGQPGSFIKTKKMIFLR
jgi:hypothetical protein